MKNYLLQPLISSVRSVWRQYVWVHTEILIYKELNDNYKEERASFCLIALKVMAIVVVGALLSACSTYALYLLMWQYNQVFILGPLVYVLYLVGYLLTCMLSFMGMGVALPIIVIHLLLIPSLCLYFTGKLIITYALAAYKYLSRAIDA